jgi:hypothetical protein
VQLSTSLPLKEKGELVTSKLKHITQIIICIYLPLSMWRGDVLSLSK